LATTQFGRSWFELIGSAELKSLADDSSLQVAFVPHPNMQAHIGAADVPDWVSTHSYLTSDVQALMARAAVTITDYSSLAFEAAYLECPVVYYQFDHDDFFSGTHAYRKGGWDASTHGFGPVVFDRAAVLAAARDAITHPEPVEPYLSRMRTAFPYHDGRCCERAFESIVSLTRPASYEDAFRFLGDEAARPDRSGVMPAAPDSGTVDEADAPDRGQPVDSRRARSEVRG
jgi:CDP-glycerol glycerophosphotransferase (TagB/SpsB family)